ncbi:MAG: DnaJ domain-containing protein [Thermodesulfobacteriota bacterium]|nr:DnaJ domain-containing protein [Thermodesulfobacteriota bacterium]
MLKRFWPVLLWLLYFVSPVDLFPDTVFGPGWTDDLALLGLLYWYLKRRKRKAESEGEGSRGRSTASDQGRDRGPEGGYRRPAGSADGAGKAPHRRDPFEVLGVAPDASWDEIRSAYHRQANRYHPDKVSHLGEEFQQLANEKFQDIQWAYETMRREKGRG